MTINDLLAAGIEIQGSVQVKRGQMVYLSDSVYSIPEEIRELEIKYIYPDAVDNENGIVVYEVEE